MSGPDSGRPYLGHPRDELWAIACGLSARHQSQLKLLARQVRRQSSRRPSPWARGLARRWWCFETDYAHPLEIPAARRLVLFTWRLRPLARVVHDTVALGLVVLLCERGYALNAAAPGLGLLSTTLLVFTLAVMGRRIGVAIRLMRG
jgi:hypothetical protein